MDNLVEFEVLPKKFKELTNKHFLRACYIFGKMRGRSWRIKGPKSKKVIGKNIENYPGAQV